MSGSKGGDIFNYDRHTGLVEYCKEEDGKLFFYVEGDQQPFMDDMAETRAIASDKTRKGLFDNGREMHLHAVLDPVTMVKLRNSGIDIYSKDPAMQRRMFLAIERDYAYCKVTNRKHIPKP